MKEHKNFKPFQPKAYKDLVQLNEHLYEFYKQSEVKEKFQASLLKDKVG